MLKKVRTKIETFIQNVENEGKTPHYKKLPLRLVDNRKQQYEEVLKAIAIKCKGKTPEMARKIIKIIVGEWKKMHLDEKDKQYKYKPYCGIIIYQFDR